MAVTRAAPVVIPRCAQQYFIGHGWGECMHPGQSARVIWPMAVGSAHGSRVITKSRWQHGCDVEFVIVRTVGHTSEQQVLVGETMVDPNRRGGLRPRGQYRYRQVEVN